MKILFYDTKSYDRESFDSKAAEYPEIQIEYLKSELSPSTAPLAQGYDAVCAFVSSDIGKETIAEAVVKAGFSQDVRGERLSTGDFVRLSDMLCQN